MHNRKLFLTALGGLALGAVAMFGCRNTMPHAFTWPGTGDLIQTHPKPPEGGYYSNWDPYAMTVELKHVGKDVNPVRTQHVLVATVKDKDGKPLPNRRVEWMVQEGSVGDIVEVDSSGWRNSRGYKVDNHYAVSHTNNFRHVLDRGNSDPSDDIQLEPGDTWCVITSPVEGETNVTVWAPGIYDWEKHKAFAVKRWYDVKWEFPPQATNPTGTTHEFVTRVSKYSDNTPLAGYDVTYTILDGPPGSFEPGGRTTASVKTDGAGLAKVTLKQAQPAEGTNNVGIEIMRPENAQCCKPAVKIAEGRTSKTWIGPKIAIDKNCQATALVGDKFNYTIVVSNPSQVDATNVVVTDTIPDGIQYVSSTPAAQASGAALTWNLGTVKANGNAQITVAVQAARVGRFENCAEVRANMGLQGRDCCVTTVTAPKLAIEKRCTAEVILCNPIEYVIVVRNAGDGVAKNVKVTDTLPAGISATGGGGTVNVGDLAPGQSKEIRYTAKASAKGSYTNKAVATADGGLTAEASCTTVVKQPVLSVTKTGPANRFIGRPAAFEITVSNTGDIAATQTTLVDPIPAGTSFISATEGGRLDGGRAVWNLGTIEPGASRKVSITLNATAATNVENVATATAVCAEASGKAPLVVKGVPAILLECVDNPDPMEVGGQVTYTIEVTNQGSAVGTNIVIECTLPAEQEFVSAQGPTQHTASGKSVTFAPLPSLAPQARATYIVVVKGLKAGDVRFAVSLKSDQMETTANETESTRFYE